MIYKDKEIAAYLLDYYMLAPLELQLRTKGGNSARHSHSLDEHKTECHGTKLQRYATTLPRSIFVKPNT
jgi:hypothetical protein